MDLHSLLARKLSVTLLHEADFCSKFSVDGMSRKPEKWNFENFTLGFCRPTFSQQRVEPCSEDSNQNSADKDTLSTRLAHQESHGCPVDGRSEATYWRGKTKIPFHLNYQAEGVFTKHTKCVADVGIVLCQSLTWLKKIRRRRKESIWLT